MPKILTEETTANPPTGTDSLIRYQLYIGGKWVDPASGAWFESEEPYRGAPWSLIPRGDARDVDRAVEAAHEAFVDGDWPDFTPSRRGQALRRIGDCFAERAESLARIEARDNGKRLAEALPQFRYLPQWFYYYAGLADKIEGQVIPIDIPEVFNYTRYEPLGVISAITPWNSPVMLACWKLAPALAGGNTVVLKPSSHASASTLEFMRVFEDAGVPPGVVNVVTGFHKELGERLVTHPKVAKVSFTGSNAGGREVNRLAAGAIKRVTLELGGKSPQIVCDDANLENAVNGVISGIFQSNGQTCIAGSRLLLHEHVHDSFLERLRSAMTDLKMGDPADPATQIGPIANRMQFEKILKYLEIAKNEGANCFMGGARSDRPGCEKGWFIEPTIFTDVNPGMRIAREEIFGPVLCVTPFSDDDEAVRIANDSLYGLAAGVWTQHLRRAHQLAARLQSGTVYINTYRSVSVTSPAGGYKQSGIGRENGAEMMKDYLQLKSVWVSMAERIPNPLAGVS